MTIVPMSDSEKPLLGNIVRQNVEASVSDFALRKKLVILDALRERRYGKANRSFGS